MQDNRLQKEKDPAFEDKAWMDMRKLLDTEMPVQKKERSLFWWWGSAGILLFVMAVSLYVFLNKKQARTFNEKNIAVKETPSSITKKEQEQIVPNRNDLTKNTETAELKIASIDETSFNKEKTKSQKTNDINDHLTIAQFNRASTNTIQKGTARSTALDNRIYPNVIIADDDLNLQNSNNNLRKALEEITHSSLGSPTFYKEELVKLVEEKEQVSIQNIPSLEIRSLPIESYKPTFPVQTIPNKSRMDWALVASLGTFKLTRFNEYAIGVKTTYQWHPKWRVGTGLNYHYFRFNGLVRNDKNINTFSVSEPEVDRSMDNMDSIEPANTTGAEASSDQEDNGDLATTEIEQTFIDPLALSGNGHYLSMPLFMEYEVSTRLKVDIGTAYYYKLTTSYDAVDNRIKPSSWTAFVGVGYEFTPYFDLRFSYERSWSKHRSNSVSTQLIDSNTIDYEFLDRAAISPLESRLKITGIWRF